MKRTNSISTYDLELSQYETYPERESLSNSNHSTSNDEGGETLADKQQKEMTFHINVLPLNSNPEDYQHFTLYFEDTEHMFTVYFNDYICSAFDFACYLHYHHHVNNFDLKKLYYKNDFRMTRTMKESSEIFLGDNIVVSGGFGQYLAESWNRIMHSMNGNMEMPLREEEKIRQDVDKKYQKARTDKNERKAKFVKDKDFHKKNAMKKNKKGQLVYRKKEFNSKVHLEVNVNDRDYHLKPEAINLSEPASPKQYVDIEDVVDDSADNAGNRPDAVTDEKKKEKEVPVDPNTDPDYEQTLDNDYEYFYIIKGEKVPPHIQAKTTWFGFIPKFTFAPVSDNSKAYFVLPFLLFLLFLFLLNPLFDNYVSSILFSTISSLHRFAKFQPLGVDNFAAVLYGYTLPVLFKFSHFIYTLWMSYDISFMNVQWYIIKRMLLFILFNLYVKKFNRRFSCLFNFQWLATSQPYYHRKVQITEHLYTNERTPLCDLRQEAERNFKITQDQHVYNYFDELFIHYPIGYVGYDGKFVETDSVVEEKMKSTYSCDLELVAQMLNSKSMSMTVSAEGMIERLGNSTNLGPFINGNKLNHFQSDLNNNSARLATHICLHWRYYQRETDIFDQLFRQGDLIRLMKYPEF